MITQLAYLGYPEGGMGKASQKRYMFALPCHSAIARHCTSLKRLQEQVPMTCNKNLSLLCFGFLLNILHGDINKNTLLIQPS